MLAYGIQRLHTTPVELHRGADAIGTRTENHHTLSVVFVGDVVIRCGRVATYRALSLICEIQVVGLCRIFRCEGIYLLNYWEDTPLLAQVSHLQHCLVHVGTLLFESDGTCYLEVGEAINLRRAQQVLVDRGNSLLLHSLINIDDMLQFLKEPTVNLGKFVNAIDIVLWQVHSL